VEADDDSEEDDDGDDDDTNADDDDEGAGFETGYQVAAPVRLGGRRAAASVWYGATKSATNPPPYAAKRRIIFTISTGHTGTMWLVRVLRCSSHPIVANHEAKPSLVSFHLVLLQGLARTYGVRQGEKLALYVEALMNATEAGVGSAYADISHMFIKSWQDLVRTATPHSTRPVRVTSVSTSPTLRHPHATPRR